MHYSQTEYEKAFMYGNNQFWKGVMKSWPSVQKHFICENVISDGSFHCQNLTRNNELMGGKSLLIQNQAIQED